MKLFVCLVAILFSFQIWGQKICPIIPTPTSYSAYRGEFKVSSQLHINPNELPLNILTFLQGQLKTNFDIDLITQLHEAEGHASSVGRLSFHIMDSLPDEGYLLTIFKNAIKIYSGSEAGYFYGINSLLQLFASANESGSISECRISDAPKFEWRGLHLDVSRHFFTVEEIKRFIDLMALYKFNKFHWHLTDDQGWRIEIKKYPKLTEIGAYRDSTVIGHYNDKPRTYKVEKYGGFYTQEQILDVVKYASNKFIDVIPEIEMPGHSRAALAAYPHLSCNEELQPVPGLWGIFDEVYCSKKESIDFMKDVLGEVLNLFPSEYIHIGGDEAPKTRWKNCKKCQNVILENNLKDEDELQSYFIAEIDKFLTKNGRKLIGWDEILEGGLSPNAAVMSWRGEEGGIEAAKQGHEVVMSPTTYCYFDYYQSGHKVEPLAIGGFLPLEKVYRYNPIPKELTEEEAAYILGGQANLWTEYIPDMKHLEYMTYPRALALIEGLWCERKLDYRFFLAVFMKHQENYLKLHKVNYSRSVYLPKLLVKRAKNGVNLSFQGITNKEEFLVSYPLSEGSKTYTEKRVNASDNIFVSAENKGDFPIDLTSERMDIEMHYNFHKHVTLGAPVELITPAHPKYDNNGSLNLVDGIRGQKEPWKGNEWLGFREDTIEFILEYPKRSKQAKLSIGFLESNGSWIYLPNTVELYGSMDKEKWKKLMVSEVNGDEVHLDCGKKKANYYKLRILPISAIPEGRGGAGSAPWTFIDEVYLKILD